MKRLLLLTCHFWEKPVRGYFSSRHFLAKKLFPPTLSFSKPHNSIRSFTAAALTASLACPAVYKIDTVEQATFTILQNPPVLRR